METRIDLKKGIHEYLDWSRGALYGLALACLVLSRTDLPPRATALLLLALGFLTLDGWARYAHRVRLLELTLASLAQATQNDAACRRMKLWFLCSVPFLFAFEIVGLFFFVSWAVQFVGDRLAFDNRYFSLAIFAGTACACNAIQIMLWPGKIGDEPISFGRYLYGVFTKDALTVAPSEPWREAVRTFLSWLASQMSRDWGAQDRSFGRPLLILLRAGLGSLVRAVAHLLLQISAIHVFYLNLTFAVYLWCASHYSLAPDFTVLGAVFGLQGEYVACTVMAWIYSHWKWALILGVFSYLPTSCIELARLRVLTGQYASEEPDAEQGIWEKRTQVAANSVLVLALLVFLASVKVRILAGVTLGMQATVMCIMMIGSVVDQVFKWNKVVPYERVPAVPSGADNDASPETEAPPL